MENHKHLYLTVGDLEMEHHACANLEHIFPYSRHFSANAQGTPGNYFRLLEKHGQELVWTLTGIVQIVDRNCANNKAREWDAFGNGCFYLRRPENFTLAV